MYEPEDLQLVLPCNSADEDGYCPENGHPRHIGKDARGEITWQPPFVQLPHSCDNWLIGGKSEIVSLINDLQDALKKIEGLDDFTRMSNRK